MLVLLVALTCSLTVIMTEWLNNGDIKVINSITVQIFLIIIISMAILVMVSIFVLSKYYSIANALFKIRKREDANMLHSLIEMCISIRVKL